MRFVTRLLPIAPLAFAMALSAAPAAAQTDADKATARQLGIEAQEALDKKDFKTAEDRFRRADQLFRAPTLALGLARALSANGKYVAAQETYNRIIRDGAPAGSPPAFVKAVEDAKAEVTAVSAKIGSVVITVTGAENPKITLDDQPFPAAALGVKRPVDPGAHVVRASADGYKPAEVRVTVGEAGSANATLTLEKDANAVAAAAVPAAGPAGAPPNADQGSTPPPISTEGGSLNKPLGFVALGVGGVGLVVGGITGFIALGKHADLEKACPGGVCQADKKDEVSRYRSMGTISTIGFVVGAVGVAAGTVLLLTAPSGAKAASVRVPYVAKGARPEISPYVGATSVGALGQF